MDIILEIPDTPKMPNELLRKHWSIITHEKNKWHRLVNLFLRHNKPPKPASMARITLTRYSTKEPDFDGLVGSFKYVIDALVKCGVIIDDKYSVIGESTYKWNKCKQKEQRIEVRIEL